LPTGALTKVTEDPTNVFEVENLPGSQDIVVIEGLGFTEELDPGAVLRFEPGFPLPTLLPTPTATPTPAPTLTPFPTPGATLESIWATDPTETPAAAVPTPTPIPAPSATATPTPAATFTPTFTLAWLTRTSAPNDVKAGGALATDGTDLYASRGRDKMDFWRLNVGSSSCSVLPPAPEKVDKGGALVYANGFIYAPRGDGKKRLLAL